MSVSGWRSRRGEGDPSEEVVEEQTRVDPRTRAAQHTVVRTRSACRLDHEEPYKSCRGEDQQTDWCVGAMRYDSAGNLVEREVGNGYHECERHRRRDSAVTDRLG